MALTKGPAPPEVPRAPTSEPSLKGPTVGYIYGDNSNDRANLSKYLGQLLELETNGVRVSVTLRTGDGSKVGWFRKEDVAPSISRDPGLVALVLTANTVMLITRQEAVKHGYKFGSAKAPAPPAPVQNSEASRQFEKEKKLRELLFLPARLKIQYSEQGHWLMSDDGDHWLHLIESGTTNYLLGRLETARQYAFDNYEYLYPENFYLREKTISNAKAAVAAAPAAAKTQTQPPKETAMSNISAKVTAAINVNKSAAETAGYMEAGRLANNQAAKLAAKHLPMMLRGYADTPLGKLVIANLASAAVKQLRPNDATLNELTEAMIVQGFQSLYQTVDLDGILDSLLSSPELQKATSKLKASQAE